MIEWQVVLITLLFVTFIAGMLLPIQLEISVRMTNGLAVAS